MPGLKDDSVQSQELHCHACGKYVQFEIDLALDGNHVLNCPNCNHEHCRVVRNGVITDGRWDQRNGMTHTINQVTYTSASTTMNITGWYTTNSTTTVYF